MDAKTINAWMSELGYEWVEGKEELAKGFLTYNEAADEIGRLLRKGAVKKHG